MPKVTLKVVNPYPVNSSGSPAVVCNNPQDCTVHQELISAIIPYWDQRTRDYIPGVNYVYLKETALPLIVKISAAAFKSTVKNCSSRCHKCITQTTETR